MNWRKQAKENKVGKVVSPITKGKFLYKFLFLKSGNNVIFVNCLD